MNKRLALIILTIAMVILSACKDVKSSCQTNMCGIGSPAAAWQELDTNGDNLFTK